MRLFKKNKEPLPLKHVKEAWSRSLRVMAACTRDTMKIPPKEAFQLLARLMYLQWADACRAAGVSQHHPVEVPGTLKQFMNQEGLQQLEDWLNTVPEQNWAQPEFKENDRGN